MIYIHNEYDEIVETYTSLEHMYKVMRSRYTALQNKRNMELHKAFNRGWLYGSFTAACAIISFILIFKFL